VQTLNNAKSLIYRAGTRRPTISKTVGQNLIIIIIIIIIIILEIYLTVKSGFTNLIITKHNRMHSLRIITTVCSISIFKYENFMVTNEKHNEMLLQKSVRPVDE
jgi:hypothetical protein